MARVTEDLIEGSYAFEDKNGLAFKRVFLVTELSDGYLNPATARLAADFVSGFYVPRYGDQLPGNNLYVATVEAFPFPKGSKEACKVIVTYRPPDFSDVDSPLIRWHGSSREVTTKRDHAGNVIKVNYTNTEGIAYPERVGEIQGVRGFGVLEIERTEPNFPSLAVEYQSQAAINSSGFQNRAAYTWWLRTVDVWGQLYRPGWRVRYLIEHDPTGYLRFATVRDAFDNVPVDIEDFPVPGSGANPQAANGWTSAFIGTPRNFGALGLPNVL